MRGVKVGIYLHELKGQEGEMSTQIGVWISIRQCCFKCYVFFYNRTPLELFLSSYHPLSLFLSPFSVSNKLNPILTFFILSV